MKQTLFAIAVAASALVGVSGSSYAAPIAPLSGVSNAATAGVVTQVRWWGYRHRHWCYWHPRRCRHW